MKINILLLIIFLGCASKISKVPPLSMDYLFPYHLDSLDYSTNIPPILEEVSGICIWGDSSILAIQDEDGILFELSAADGSLLRSYPFGPKGDYEGITIIGDSLLYILRSDGTIFELKNWSIPADFSIDTIETPLDKKNDTEGLCYDPTTHSLLIACKAKASIGKTEDRGERAIYRFSLSERRLILEPAYILTYNQMHRFLSTHLFPDKEDIKLLSKLEKNPEQLFFYPSEVAVHPFSGHIYLLASKGKCLLVLNRGGEILHAIPLSSKEFRQPEGLCFDTAANLYIASEGSGQAARIYRFPYLLPSH